VELVEQLPAVGQPAVAEAKPSPKRDASVSKLSLKDVAKRFSDLFIVSDKQSGGETKAAESVRLRVQALIFFMNVTPRRVSLLLPVVSPYRAKRGIRVGMLLCGPGCRSFNQQDNHFLDLIWSCQEP